MTCTDETLFKLLDWRARLFKSKGDLPFAPVKLYTKWSRSLQATYMVFVDYRGSDTTPKEREAFARQLCESWEVDYNQTIPFIDSDLVSEYVDRTSPVRDSKKKSVKSKAGNYASPSRGAPKSTGQKSGHQKSGLSKKGGGVKDSPKKMAQGVNDRKLKEKLEEM